MKIKRLKILLLMKELHPDLSWKDFNFHSKNKGNMEIKSSPSDLVHVFSFKDRSLSFLISYSLTLFFSFCHLTSIKDREGNWNLLLNNFSGIHQRL